jgi:hypothetical protein
VVNFDLIYLSGAGFQTHHLAQHTCTNPGYLPSITIGIPISALKITRRFDVLRGQRHAQQTDHHLLTPRHGHVALTRTGAGASTSARLIWRLV